MARTPPSAKRMKSRGVKSSGKLEGWFQGIPISSTSTY